MVYRSSLIYQDFSDHIPSLKILFLTGQVWSGVPLDKSGLLIGQVRSHGYIGPLTDFQPTFHSFSFLILLYRRLGRPKGDLELPRGFPSPLLLKSGLHGFGSVQGISSVLHVIYDFFQTVKYIAISFGSLTPSIP
jgi:hypothetical protein